MGLFNNRSNDTTTTHHQSTTTGAPNRRSGLFGRSTPATTTDGTTTNNHHSGGLLHRHEDPSITAARDRVVRAEASEKDADKALYQARISVREAREHVKRLEREAAEEARLAKIKQNQAKSISKRAKPLGRHNV